MMQLKLPFVSSDKSLAASGNLKRLFGVITIRGLRIFLIACLLRRWKIWDGELGIQTCMLFAAHSCKNLSNLALLCSGPIPSNPCGRSITSPESLSHLCSALTIN